ncbi:hypothetical protein ACIHCV_40525 [Streptomyces sp. NPDC051956]|uniref:hypothetical protein n=1 Tax=Streptomyces sp. NPDC051956 TaxID=3365677 RepID=UPI0037D02E92
MSAGSALGSSLVEVEDSGDVVADGEAVPGSALGEGSVVCDGLDVGEGVSSSRRWTLASYGSLPASSAGAGATSTTSPI